MNYCATCGPCDTGCGAVSILTYPYLQRGRWVGMAQLSLGYRQIRLGRASTDRWRQVLAAGKVFDCEYRLRGADGSYRWFIGRNVPVRDAQGSITGWFGTATDI